MKSVLSGTTSPQPDMYPCSYRLNCSGNQTIQQVVTVGGKEEIAYVRSSFRIKVGQPIQVVSNTPLESQNWAKQPSSNILILDINGHEASSCLLSQKLVKCRNKKL